MWCTVPSSALLYSWMSHPKSFISFQSMSTWSVILLVSQLSCFQAQYTVLLNHASNHHTSCCIWSSILHFHPLLALKTVVQSCSLFPPLHSYLLSPWFSTVIYFTIPTFIFTFIICSFFSLWPSKHFLSSSHEGILSHQFCSNFLSRDTPSSSMYSLQSP